jgi:DnaJ-class molecular chaperone
MSTATTTHRCQKCGDKGYVYTDGFSVRDCPRCDGEGWVYVMPTSNNEPVKVVPCRRCHGDSVVDSEGCRKSCPSCMNKGRSASGTES